MGNIISIKNLTKNFNNTPVLNNINLDINEGEITVIVGPSGAGKSTFLRCLNLLEKPTNGEIIFMGQDITLPTCNIYKIRQKMCMIFQQYNLFLNYSVLENITIAPIKLLFQTPEEAKQKAYQLLERFGLKDKAKQFPCQLSGGQKQRVAILRALAMSPSVMLFDEPTSALDPFMKSEVQKLIKILSKEKVTIVIITHDMSFAKEVATKLIQMKDGCLTQLSNLN